MTLSHIELQRTYDHFLGETIKEGIDQFVGQNLDDPDFDYVTECIWKTDSMIGGLEGIVCRPIR